MRGHTLHREAHNNPSGTHLAPASDRGVEERIWQFRIAFNNLVAARRILFALAVPGVIASCYTKGFGVPLVWLAAVTLWYAVDANLVAKRAQVHLRAGHLRKAKRLVCSSLFLGTSIWGLSCPLFWTPETPSHQAEQYLATGFAAVAVGVLTSPSLALTLSCSLPMAAMWIWFTLQPTGLLHYELMGFMMFYLVMIVMVSNHLDALGRRSFELSRENKRLVSELNRAVIETDSARARAEAANEAKSTFLANMSHEIRTPLNAILGFSEIIRDEVFGPVGIRRYQIYADDIHRSGSHLLAVINDILDLSRIEAGEYEIESTRIEFGHVFSSVMTLFDIAAREAGVVLHRQITPDLPILWADERSLRQILINLVANAIRFTPPGGRVTLSAGLTPDGGIFLRVIDTGLGISQEELERVTERFAQAKQEAALRQRGTGLGLAIVKQLVELHGGELVLKSRLGMGTQAEACFPPERTFAAGRSSVYAVA